MIGILLSFPAFDWLYKTGRRPVSAVADTQGLNMTVQSYNGRLDFGLVACRDPVPDLWDLCHMLPDALDELKVAAGI